MGSQTEMGFPNRADLGAGTHDTEFTEFATPTRLGNAAETASYQNR